MNSLDSIIENAKILNKEDEQKLILQTFEPFALSLYIINKQAKKERDFGNEELQKENIEDYKTDAAHNIFKIKKNTFKDTTIATIMDEDIDYTKPETFKPLIDKITKKCEHPFFLITTIYSLKRTGIITEGEFNSEYMNKIFNYIDNFYTKTGQWKEKIDLLPAFNEEEVKRAIIKASSFIPPYKRSGEVELHFKKKDNYYVKKDMFLEHLYNQGLRASEMHYFLTPYGNVYNTLPLIEYGGFRFHTKSFQFVEKDKEIKKVNIEGEISSVSKHDMNIEDAENSLNKALALLSSYEKGEIDIKELCEKANFVIDSFQDLKKQKEKLQEEIIK